MARFLGLVPVLCLLMAPAAAAQDAAERAAPRGGSDPVPLSAEQFGTRPTEEALCSGIDVSQQTLSIDAVKPLAHVSHNRLIEFQRAAQLGADLRRGLLGEFTIVCFHHAAPIAKKGPVGAELWRAVVEYLGVLA